MYNLVKDLSVAGCRLAQDLLPVRPRRVRPLLLPDPEHLRGLTADPAREQLLGQLGVQPHEALEQVAQAEIAEEDVVPAGRSMVRELLEEGAIPFGEVGQVPRLLDDL